MVKEMVSCTRHRQIARSVASDRRWLLLSLPQIANDANSFSARASKLFVW